MAGARDIRAGRAFVEADLEDSKLQRGLKRAQRRLRAFGQAVGAVGRKMMMLGGAALAPLIGAAKIFSSMGDKVAKMARRTGMSVEALSELSFAADRSGTELSALENGLRRMQRTIYDAGEGLSTAVDGFENLGVTVADLEALAPEDQFKLLADRISKVEDPTRRAALAMVIFGRSGTALIPMMENGAAGIEKLQQACRRLGITMKAEDAAAAEVFTDMLGDLWSVVKHGIFLVGAALAPVLQDSAKRLIEIAKAASRWIQANGQMIASALKLAAAITAVGIGLMVLGPAIKAVAFGLAMLKASVWLTTHAVMALQAVLMLLSAHPVIAVVVGAALVVSAILGMRLAFKAASSAIGTATRALFSFKSAAEETGTTFSHVAKGLREYGDGLIESAERLAELRKIQDPTVADLLEMDDIVGRLTKAFPNLADEIAAVGTTMEKTESALAALRDGLGDLYGTKIRSAARDMARAVEEMNDKITEAYKARRLATTRETAEAAEERIHALRIERSEMQQRQKELEEMAGRIERGELVPEMAESEESKRAAEHERKTAALRAKYGWPEAPEPVTEEQRKAQKEALARLNRVKLQAIENVHKRDVALINERYDQEVERARANGATQLTLDRIKAARQVELDAADARRDKKLAAEKKAAAERETAKKKEAADRAAVKAAMVADAEKARRQSIEELRLRTTLKGIELEKALLALEERRALAEAEASGESLEAIKEQYSLRRKLLAQTSAVGDGLRKARATVIGTFQAANVLGLQAGGVVDPILAINEKIERNTRPLRRAEKLTFT